MTDFRLLGPLEAVEDGEVLPVPVGKPRALLARLLLAAERVVAVETLVDGIWGDHPPVSANKLLQVYVSQLRKVLGAGAIETRRPGYRVRIEDGRLDLVRFEALTEAAAETTDPARRSEILGEALSLWRGPALAEFRAEPFARPAARRLAELRLAALEERIDADLELGRHDRLVGELQALVAEEPLRERPRRQLMLALYRSGRQADALAQYREARRLLVDELGIEPTPALQELERAILRRDAALADAHGEPGRRRGCVLCAGADLAQLAAPLCGRERELVLVELAATPAELAGRSARLEHIRTELGARDVDVRVACFTSDAPADDLVRLAAEQEAELLVTEEASADAIELFAAAPCDVALALGASRFEPAGPVVVPFGGGREEWAALELAAWIARSHGLHLRLLGTEADGSKRDASRMLAGASLALQRFAGISAEPVIVSDGQDAIQAQAAALIVTAFAVKAGSTPVLLVRGGLRPGGLAPDRTLTRFSWSLAG
jgi:DNA-binding SARP family transcriptional activator